MELVTLASRYRYGASGANLPFIQCRLDCLSAESPATTRSVGPKFMDKGAALTYRVDVLLNSFFISIPNLVS
jgi:hypothetical protein